MQKRQTPPNPQSTADADEHAKPHVGASLATPAGADKRRPYSLHTLAALADLLDYPGPDFPARLAAAPFPGQTALADLLPDAREELYAATFDVTPSCVPYVSIHLFGEENFKRGEFMAALQARYAETGFATGAELPDHLAVLLRYAAQAGETERRELVEFCLLGPLGRMIESLGEAHPYRAVLVAVREELQAGYPAVRPAPSPVEQMQRHGLGCGSCAALCDRDEDPVLTN